MISDKDYYNIENVFVCYVDIVFNYDDLINVVYLKLVILSIKYDFIIRF